MSVGRKTSLDMKIAVKKWCIHSPNDKKSSAVMCQLSSFCGVTDCSITWPVWAQSVDYSGFTVNLLTDQKKFRLSDLLSLSVYPFPSLGLEMIPRITSSPRIATANPVILTLNSSEISNPNTFPAADKISSTAATNDVHNP